MEKKVSIVLIGINGYGSVYLGELLNRNDSVYIQGVVDIAPEKSMYHSQLLERNIPVYTSAEDFYGDSDADLAIISTPIHLHKQQAILAMEHGSNVLCEKPVSGNPEDIKEMADVRDKTGKFLAIGFNWSFTSPVQELKQDIMNGVFGKAKRFKSLVLWPRNEDYYARSPWAGKKYSQNGEMIFDSVANNATAHFLHHLFYLLGSETDTSARLRDAAAELYRVNQIETFDTCAVRFHTTENVEILYYASHAVKEEIQPRFELEFEKAVLTYQPDKSEGVTVRFHGGNIKEYPPLDHGSLVKLDVCIDAVKNGSQQILCGLEAASAHVYAVHAMHASVPDVPSFPADFIHYEEKEKLHWIGGLGQTLLECYEQSILPSDIPAAWSKLGNKVDF